MNWMDKLERKWGKYAIPDIHRYLIIAILIGYAISYLASGLFDFLTFNVNAILHGQIWRLVTWILIPPSGQLVFTLLFLICLIPMGHTLEQIFGNFKMNVYFIGGIILSDIGGFITYFVCYLLTGLSGVNVSLTTYYLLLTTFMALALCMPDATVNLYFVLPIKMKWMLVLYFADLAYEIYENFRVGSQFGSALGRNVGMIMGVVLSAQIVFALVNLGLFFYFTKQRVSRKQKKRQKEFRAQFATEPRPGSGISKHKCAICGRTELDDPNLVFRYCSKCEGNYEYCQDHLFTHKHVKRMN